MRVPSISLISPTFAQLASSRRDSLPAKAKTRAKHRRVLCARGQKTLASRPPASPRLNLLSYQPCVIGRPLNAQVVTHHTKKESPFGDSQYGPPLCRLQTRTRQRCLIAWAHGKKVHNQSNHRVLLLRQAFCNHHGNSNEGTVVDCFAIAKKIARYCDPRNTETSWRQSACCHPRNCDS